MPIPPVLMRLRQFQVNLSYVVRPWLKKIKNYKRDKEKKLFSLVALKLVF
jgi:hypothetical protein